MNLTPGNPVEYIRLIQLFLCLFGSLFLGILWMNISTKKSSEKEDLGLILLALALLTWVGSLIYRINTDCCSDSNLRLLSTINNGFFLASLTYFRFGFGKLKKRFSFFNNEISWVIRVLIWTSIIWVLVVVLPKSPLIVGFDFIYSCIVLVAVAWGINFSFYKRGYGIPFIGIGIILSLLLIISQIYNIGAYFLDVQNEDDCNCPCPLNIDGWLIASVVGQIAFVNLLLVLALTWAVEETNKTKEQEIQSLNDTINTLTNQNRNLEENNEAKEQEIQSLNDTINTLTNQNRNLEENNEAKEQEIQKLNDTINALQKQELETFSENRDDAEEVPLTNVVLPSFLRIGLENNIYFFNLTLPEKNIENFLFQEKKPVNLFKFLLFYAYSKFFDKTHIEQDSGAYTTATFNNIIIQSLNSKLHKQGFAQIKRDDLLKKKSTLANFELIIVKEKIKIVGREELEQIKEINSLLKPLLPLPPEQ